MTPELVEVIAAKQGAHEYPVRVGGGAAALAASLAGEHDRAVLVTCKNVLATPFGKGVKAALLAGSELALVHVLPDGERGKTLAELERAAVAMLEAGATRRSIVIALGGGAVSDAAGFLAATFMRGLPWAAVPTTLLAMVDAAIGGKTAVNLPAAKNAVGAFHPPEAVLADPAALRTLPARELASGKGEVMKYAALQPGLLETFSARVGGAAVDPVVIATCARMKVDVVEADPTEKGPRKLLNLGHTFGHGVEAAGGFSRYTHGEAVSIGLAFAFRLAARLGRVDESAAAAIEAGLVAAGLPIRAPSALARKAAALMAFDKKRGDRGLLWVLPKADGDRWSVEWDVTAAPGAVEATVAEIAGTPRGGGSTAGAKRARLPARSKAKAKPKARKATR